MAPKKKAPAKGKKGAAEAAAGAGAEPVDDIVPEDTKRALRMEIRSLKEEIDKQENSVYLYNDERRRINVLWIYA